MGKYRLADARGRFILRILPVALLLNLALAGPGYAQMGVATGNGVATPAKPLPAGMKPPVVRYEHKRPGSLIHFDIKRLARSVRPGSRPRRPHPRDPRRWL